MNGVSAGSVVSSSRAQASEALELAHAKILKMLPEGLVQQGSVVGMKEKSIWQQWLDPELPPILAPIPGFCRLIAILIIAPIIFACLTDFAGYAIFRTLGFRRRRVRIKESHSPSQHQQSSDPTALTASNLAANGQQRGSESPSMIKAPLLSPGAYDADALLRHRARSISGESQEAEEEWNRTGGRFARVSTVRANQEAAAASQAASSKLTENAFNLTNASSASSSPLVLERDSTKYLFARAHHVGVEGALGYSDTDADDSGAESGRSSPELGRKSWRRGLSSGLGFTPVSPKESIENDHELFGRAANKPMYDDISLRSPMLSSDPAAIAASRAADLEPAESLVPPTSLQS